MHDMKKDKNKSVSKKEIINKKEIKALLKAIKSICKHGDFNRTARLIFNEAKKIIGAASGYVALLSADSKKNELLFLDAGGLPCSVDPSLPMPIRGLRAEAYKHKKAVFNNSFMKSKWLKFLPRGHVILSNVLFAPLVIDNKAVGLMGLANKPGGFTDKDAELAAVFGEFAALAFHNNKNLDILNNTIKQLKTALSEVKQLKGIIPICAKCKSIRNDKGYWQRVETYLETHADVEFTHGLCPDCAKALRKEYNL